MWIWVQKGCWMLNTVHIDPNNLLFINWGIDECENRFDRLILHCNWACVPLESWSEYGSKFEKKKSNKIRLLFDFTFSQVQIVRIRQVLTIQRHPWCVGHKQMKFYLYSPCDQSMFTCHFLEWQLCMYLLTIIKKGKPTWRRQWKIGTKKLFCCARCTLQSIYFNFSLRELSIETETFRVCVWSPAYAPDIFVFRIYVLCWCEALEQRLLASPKYTIHLEKCEQKKNQLSGQ